jgi:hypothetical protein
MRALLRLAGCAVFTGLLIAGGCALRPDVFVDLGLDWWDWPNSLRQYEAASGRAEELARQDPFALEQIKAKDAIARELIDGRLTLAQATRRVLDLPGMTEYRRREIHRVFAGATAEESMSQHVIMWACDLLDKEPARAEALRRRLHAELQGR